MVMIDRNWNSKAAQSLLIYIFNFLGGDNKLTIDGRKRLTKILY
jgi:thioredoxin-like negative regulator of GroEL